MRHFPKIVLILIFCFLIFVGVFEEIITNRALDQLKNDISVLKVQIEKDFQSEKTLSILNQMGEVWKKNDEMISFFVHHKNTQDIGIEISKMKIYINDNNFQDFKASLSVIEYYSIFYDHFMGANIKNTI